MSKDKSGPAFPCGEHGARLGGMTLRDWFAGQALAGELAAQTEQSGQWTETYFPKLAEQMFQIADAMLKERSKP